MLLQGKLINILSVDSTATVVNKVVQPQGSTLGIESEGLKKKGRRTHSTSRELQVNCLVQDIPVRLLTAK